MIKYIHLACNGVAFEAHQKFAYGDLLSAKKVLVNGKQPQAGQQVMCGYCGKALQSQPIAEDELVSWIES